MKDLKKGFTLIELLVVVAIIGILASIVLVSLSSARSKGNDVKVKSQLNSIRNAAEIYANTYGNYGASGNGTFSSTVASCSVGAAFFGDVSSGLNALTTYANYPTGTAGACYTSGTAWAVSALLSTSGVYWCVDSNGVSKQTGAAVATTNC